MTAYFTFLSKLLMDTFLFLIFLLAAFNVRLSQIIKRIPPLLLLALPLSFIATVTDSMLIFTIMAYVYSAVFYSLLFRYPMMKIVSCYALVNIIINVINLIQLLVITQFTDTPFTNKTTYITEAMCFIIAMLIYWFGHFDRVYESLIVKNRISRYIILSLFGLLMLMVIYQRISVKDFMNMMMTFFFIVILILILYAGMYKNYTSLKESQKQLQVYEQYLPIIEDLIDQVRMRQHDYNNELQAISMLPMSFTDYDSLSAALSKEVNMSCSDHVIKNSALLKINMKLIAGFLFSQMNRADELDIELKIDVKNATLTSKAAEYELLDIISILFDNAFEASTAGAVIYANIDSDGSQTMIETLNKGPVLTAEMRKNFFSKGYSTKALKEGSYSRGIGLFKLKQITEKHNGSIILDNKVTEDGTFIHFQVKL